MRQVIVGLLTFIVFTGLTASPCGAEDVIPGSAVSVVSEVAGEEIEVTEQTTEENTEATEESTEAPEVKPDAIKLTKPASFKTTAIKDGIKLSWKKVSKAQQYEVYRKKKGADSYKLIETTKKCAYKDETAKYGVTYAYKVRAIAVSEGETYKSKYTEVKKCCTYRIDPSKPMVALTFDDGPSIYTPGILDALEENQCRATFFEVGNRVEQYEDTVLRIDEMGCEIGNHSYDHANLGNASASKIRKEISSTDAKIKKVIGKKPVLMRPPYGSIGTTLRQNVGKPMIMWSIDTLDWKSRNADKVYQNVMNNVSDGDIILMHDLYSSSREAAKRIIPELKKKGYQLVTVSELAEYKKVKLSAGERYSQIKGKSKAKTTACVQWVPALHPGRECCDFATGNLGSGISGGLAVEIVGHIVDYDSMANNILRPETPRIELHPAITVAQEKRWQITGV